MIQLWRLVLVLIAVAVASSPAIGVEIDQPITPVDCLGPDDPFCAGTHSGGGGYSCTVTTTCFDGSISCTGTRSCKRTVYSVTCDGHTTTCT